MGREYNVYTLRKSQLYPLQPGPVELESAEVENNIHFIRDEYVHDNLYELPDLFRDFAQTTIPSEGMQDEKVTLQSKPTLVTVKALPEKDRSPLFRGAVGNFIIEASLEKTTVTTDDAARLSIAVKGAGNMPLIIAPEVNWPAGIEPYEPRAKEDLNKLVVPVSGTKLFEYPFTIAKPGRYNIPPVSFSFFDVKQGTYKTVSTRPLSIQVTKGTGKRPVTLNQENDRNGKETLVDIIFTNRWLIIVPLAVLMMAGLFTWLYRDNKRQLNRQNSLVKLAAPEVPVVELPVNPLAISGRYLSGEDSRAFYGALNHEVKTFLSEKLEIPFTNITTRDIVTAAGRKGFLNPRAFKYSNCSTISNGNCIHRSLPGRRWRRCITWQG
jgi:hypothetical protein